MSSSLKEILARCLSFSISGVIASTALATENPAARVATVSALANVPLFFETNNGQFAGSAPFLARGKECAVRLSPTEAEILLGKSSDHLTDTAVPSRSVHLQLVGANPTAAISGTKLLAAHVNYFIGDQPEQWHAGVDLFCGVRVDEAYRGVQVIYYANQSAQLEYDFVLQPNANPQEIQFRITGADKVSVDALGNLSLQIGSQEIRQHQPVAYQQIGGVRKDVSARYQVNADGTVGFALGQFDHSQVLTIDPVLDFLTYLGGKKLEVGHAIAIDPSGNTYVAGETLSTDLAVTNVIQFGATNFSKFRGGNSSFGDAFVAKYDSAGALQFLTYLGGKTDDGALGISYDTAANAVWVTGFTDSTNFPLVNPIRSKLTGPNKNATRTYQVDAFISKLDPSGANLLFSSYFGGDNIDEGVGITTDPSGGVYVTGITSSTNFPVTPGAFQTILGGNLDAFVAKLSGAGGNYATAYATYFGGTNVEYGLGIAVDSGLNAWITGLTYSTNLYTASPLQLPPGVNVFYTNGYTFTNLNAQTNSRINVNSFRSDAFVAEVNPTGTQVPFASYLGGNNDDVGEQIAIDTSDNVFVAGYTLSQNFPTNILTTTPTNFVPAVTNQIVFPYPGTNFSSHAFVVKIVGQQLDKSTAFGGSLADEARAIAVDGNGLVYVTGSLSSTNFFQKELLVTNITTTVKHGETITNYFGILTNSPAFTSLITTNLTVGFKRGANTNDVFVAILPPDLSTFAQIIAVGGPGRDEANGIAVDPAGNAVYIIGTTTSSTNLTTLNAAQRTFGGGGKNNNRLSDAFVSKIQIVPAP